MAKESKVNLNTLSTEADAALNNFMATEVEKDLEKQREIDAESDYVDKNIKTIKAKANKKAKVAAEIEERGEVLITGRVTGKRSRPQVEPGREYENYPIKTIDGEQVLLLGARPFWDKSCEWDNGYQDQYEHFTESDHPMFFNAVVTKVKYTDHNRRVQDAWVIKTDQEIQLYIKRP